MPQRRILFADGSSLRAFRSLRDTQQYEGRFVADNSGTEEFAAYLRQHRDSLFTLLVDVSEEGFQIENIPHCSGRDREAIVARKLAQYFYGTPLTLCSSLGRLKGGRRDERLLLMALTRPQQFDPWLDVMRNERVALTGIYSLPQVIGHLVAKDSSQPLLIITATHNGLRQTFFVGNQLRFSRLTTLATNSAEESAVAAAIEAGKMHQYLLSQRMTERNKPLATRMLVHPAQMTAMRTRCQDTAELHFDFVDLLQEAQRIGLRTPPSDSHAEPLLCHLLAKSPPQDQFAPPAARAYYRLWQTRFGIKAAAAVILTSALLVAGKQGLELGAQQQQSAEIRQQVRINQQHYDQVMQGLPRMPLSTESLRALVTMYDQVHLRATGPAPLLTQLSHSLDAFPPITLENLDWSVADTLLPSSITSTATGLRNGKPPDVPPHLQVGPYAHAVVTAKLPLSMIGDQRGQLKLVADFTQHMASQPDTLVSVVTPPVDTQSGKTLRSGDDNQSAEAPRFVFLLTRKL